MMVEWFFARIPTLPPKKPLCHGMQPGGQNSHDAAKSTSEDWHKCTRYMPIGRGATRNVLQTEWNVRPAHSQEHGKIIAQEANETCRCRTKPSPAQTKQVV
jgi:hypothetical protein